MAAMGGRPPSRRCGGPTSCPGTIDRIDVTGMQLAWIEYQEGDLAASLELVDELPERAEENRHAAFVRVESRR